MKNSLLTQPDLQAYPDINVLYCCRVFKNIKDYQVRVINF